MRCITNDSNRAVFNRRKQLTSIKWSTCVVIKYIEVTILNGNMKVFH